MSASELYRASFAVNGRGACAEAPAHPMARRPRSFYAGLSFRPPEPVAAAARRAYMCFTWSCHQIHLASQSGHYRFFHPI
jgi:hypothetical protein